MTVLETLNAKKAQLQADAASATAKIQEDTTAEVAKIDAEIAAGGEHLNNEASEIEAWFAAKVAALKAWL